MKEARAAGTRLLKISTRCAAGLVIVTFLSGTTERSETPRSSLSQLRDITGIERSVVDEPKRSWIPFAAMTGLFVCLLVLLIWFRFRRQNIVVQDPIPGPWALDELARLESLALGSSGQIEQFHTHLSQLIRRYLELRFHLPASRQTTAEFLMTIGAAGKLTPGQQFLLRELFERCDLAKFAQAIFSPAECQSMTELVRKFVIETSSD